MSKNKVCIILPCYRVKHKIYSVYKKLINNKIDCLIFVDDNCPQKSVNYLKSRIKPNKKTQFMFLKKNLGVGGATLKGFRSAYRQGFDIMVKFDSDDQHKIKDLKKLIKKLREPDVFFCKGYRNLNLKDSFKRSMPLIRVLGANALTLINKITTKNFNLKDVTNGLFGIKAILLRKVNLKHLKNNYFFEQDFIFRVSLKKIQIHQVNSEVIYANETSSMNALKSIIPFLIYNFQNLFYKN
tara:strand:- start:481 stop:1200 length:720 start_codon:yes stop_codon:yes gene_type:complete